MRVKSLFCACNGRTDNPLDHFQREGCGAAAKGAIERWPLEWLLALLRQATSDKYHAGGRITATRVLGCPRETIILDNKEIEGLDVRGGNAAFWGTLAHREMEALAAPGVYQEITIPPFEFGGVMVEGKVDRVSGDFSVILDWKTHNETSQGFKFDNYAKGGLDAETAAQLNIYRIGIAKAVLKVDPVTYRPKLIAAHGANVPHGKVSWFEAEAPIMTEEALLAMRPFDDDKHPGTQRYTMKELMEQLVDANAAITRGEPVDSVISAMPLVGANVWAWRWNKQSRTRERLRVGDKCTKYCSAKRECDRIALLTAVPSGLAIPRMPTGMGLGFEG